MKLRILFPVLVLLMVFPAFSNAQTLKAYLSAGDQAMKEARYAEAIEYYKKALEFETEEPILFEKMADACRSYKDYEKAAAWYGKTITGDRENRFPRALFHYAEMKKYLGMYEESQRLYERYIAANPGDTSYFGVKAKVEATGMKTTMELSKKKTFAEVTNAGTPVNSVYSDFNGTMMLDTVLYYSSLRFLYEQTGKEDAYYVSRILITDPDNKQRTPLPMTILFNDPPTHNCNVGFSPDFKVMFFTRCNLSENAELECELYYSRYDYDGICGACHAGDLCT